MSAIDDMPEGPIDGDPGHVIWAIDRMWPCCTLCDDTAKMMPDVACLCVGGPILNEESIDKGLTLEIWPGDITFLE